MEVDVIILSYAKDDDIIRMNSNCIDSINNSSPIKFNIYLIETESNNDFIYHQGNVEVIQPNKEFNYNQFLNIGLEYCKNEWILLSNNDTIYEKNFIENMLEAHKIDERILSMSPIDDDWPMQKGFDRNVPIHYGHRIQYEISGWSILINKKVIEIIGKFDESFYFWYQDNDYSNNLKKHNVQHALITNAKVHHLLSRSNHLVKDWNTMVATSERKFINKWK